MMIILLAAAMTLAMLIATYFALREEAERSRVYGIAERAVNSPVSFRKYEKDR